MESSGVLPRPPPYGDEHFLQDFLGLGAIAQHPNTHAEEPGRGTPIELTEGTLVTRSDS
jgi:hypothetical protein